MSQGELIGEIGGPLWTLCAQKRTYNIPKWFKDTTLQLSMCAPKFVKWYQMKTSQSSYLGADEKYWNHGAHSLNYRDPTGGKHLNILELW
jgi:hypothetical protein